MGNITSTFTVGALVGTLALTSLAAQAAPMSPGVPAPAVERQASSAQQVDFRGDYRRDRYREWHGHRGYRDYRPGYRRHSDGNWYPLAAFGVGALVGGAIANSNRPHGTLDRSATWCAEHYSTYRASDNTYIRSAGVRATCVAPY